MLRRPPSHTVPSAAPPAETQFVSQLIELERDLELPSFLFEDEAPQTEVTPPVVEERWNKPFAGGVALSDRVMSHGRRTDSPPDNLPHGALRRRPSTRPVR